MIEKYWEIADEMKILTTNGIKIIINGLFYYFVKVRWMWVGDAKAKCALTGIGDVSSTYGILPGITFFNLYDIDGFIKINFIKKENLSLLLKLVNIFTPIEYYSKKKNNTLPNGPFGVLVDDKLNKFFSDKIENYVNHWPNLKSKPWEEQHEARLQYSRDILHQPQLYPALPYSLHPVVPLLHMIKTVLNHCDAETFNYFLLKSNIPLNVFEENILVVGNNIDSKFKVWKKDNYNLKKNEIKGKNPKKFCFGNLNKRQSLDLFKNSIEFIIKMDNYSNQNKIHFYSAWVLCLRVRIAECTVIYLKRYFRTNEDKELLSRCIKLNKIILRLVLEFFPQSVKLYLIILYFISLYLIIFFCLFVCFCLDVLLFITFFVFWLFFKVVYSGNTK